ncbi:MAG: hypothetical protein JXC85_02830 [Candidatus Aenigmarchaeota archaeon]|nr:hypothetical protein [Candidatus Aenigmarchaeota archaeon]
MPVFGETQKKRPAPIINEIVGRVNDNTKRLRILEDRERLASSRIGSMDESLIEKIKALQSSIDGLTAKVTAQDEKVTLVQNTLKEVVKQLQFLARKSELKRVEEKLKILDPLLMQQFAPLEEQKTAQKSPK